MKRKHFIPFVIAAAMLFTLFILFTVKNPSKSNPFKELQTTDIADMTIHLTPPDVSITLEGDEIAEALSLLQNLTFRKKNYEDVVGQGILFTITRTDGTQTALSLCGDLMKLDGVKYISEYEPAQAVNSFANGLEANDESISVVCRIIDGARTGNLLLAAQDDTGSIYRLNVNDYPLTAESSEFEELENGMLLSVTCGGTLESYPAQFDGIREIIVPESGMDNLCELYLNVLNDLWEVDSGLNSDITQLGVDLSSTRLSRSEQAAVAWAFGEQHGLEAMQGTYEEFVEMGYINDEFLYWENGCLFTITERDAGGNDRLNAVTFDATKWRSGLGAYFFFDCTSLRTAPGIWEDYSIGGQAIS